MSETVFTFPGRCGDAIHQWPIVYHWIKKNQQPVTIWLDERTCKPLVPLFKSQPFVEAVELKGGIVNYSCGGQPWHFDISTSEHHGRTIYHLGMRSFPQRQLTLECMTNFKAGIKIAPEALANEPVFSLPPSEKRNRLVIHGSSVCPHNRETPRLWRVLARIKGDLEARFEEIVFVGSKDDREVGLETYPEWVDYDDGGDFFKLATYMNESQAVIGVGSSNVSLAQWLKIPTLRVHDNIGGLAKVIWSGLGDNQANETEEELRTTWPIFRDKWLPKPKGEMCSAA